MRFVLLGLLVACTAHAGGAVPAAATTTAAATAAAAPPTAAAAPPTAAAAPPTAAAAAAPPTAAAARSAATASPPAAPASPPRGAGAACVDDSAPYDADVLRGRIAQLAAPALDGRAAGSPGDVAARAYLAEQFRCLGLTPAGTGGSYEQPFDAAGHATANLIGYIAGDDPDVGDDIVVVGAHHDHLGDGHLGANDNASGAVALLAIAQAVRHQGLPRRTIAFVLFGAEELGLRGSQAFAAQPPDALPLARVVYHINLDMVGSYASTRGVYALGTFPGLPATAIVHALRRAHPALRVRVGGRGEGSDHEAFCTAGIPYAFFWTPDRRCYHARCDTAAQLDSIHLAEISAFAGALVDRLAASPLDLAASRARLGCTGRPRG